MKSVALLVVFVATSVGLAQPSWEKIKSHMPRENEVLLSTHTDADGTRSQFIVTPDQLKQTPEWDGRGEPPLSITKACSMAEAWLKQKHTKFKSFDLQSISLSRAWHHSADNRWSYSLSLKARADVGETEVTHSFAVRLLLDGTIVEPKVQKK